MGTPVIASEVGGLAHLVQHGVTGFHIPPRNSNALAEQICILLHDEPLRTTFGTQARNLAQNYDWPVIVRHLVETYKEAQVICAQQSDHALHQRWRDTAVKWFTSAAS